MSLLDIEGLGVAFEDEDGHPLPAVQNVSFSLEKGAVTCLVGESGCGKSLTPGPYSEFCHGAPRLRDPCALRTVNSSGFLKKP